MKETPFIRPAARVVLLDRERRVLLFRSDFPARAGDTHARVVWITPGGGIEDGESFEAGALRELEEETGLPSLELGPCLWHRTDTFRFGGRLIEQREQYFLVEVDGHEVTSDGHTEEELTFLTGHRWWNVEEIGTSEELFAPSQLATLLTSLIADGAPAEPLVLGR